MTTISNKDFRSNYNFVSVHDETVPVLWSAYDQDIFIARIPCIKTTCISTHMTVPNKSYISKVELSSNGSLLDITDFVIGDKPEELIPLGLAVYSNAQLYFTLKKGVNPNHYYSGICDITLTIHSIDPKHFIDLQDKAVLCCDENISVAHGTIGYKISTNINI